MAASKKSSTVIVRVVLFGLLVVGLVFLVVDRRARSAAHDFKRELDRLLPAEEEGIMLNESVDSDRVQELAGSPPVEAYPHQEVPRTFVEIYRWQGAFRPYEVYCYYNKVGEVRLLDAVSLNAPLPSTQL